MLQVKTQIKIDYTIAPEGIDEFNLTFTLVTVHACACNLFAKARLAINAIESRIFFMLLGFNL
jgi:hypothetical protein